VSSLEDEIRDALRSQAAWLQEVRPLSLTPADQHELRAVPPASRARWLRGWRAPAAAAAVILLVAATLVTLKSLQNEHAAPVASRGTVVGPPGTPRYYVSLGPAGRTGKQRGWGITASDARTGQAIGTIPLPQGEALSGAVSGAADDRTFAVTASIGQTPISGDISRTVFGPALWEMVHIHPGSGDPVQVTKLPITSAAAGRVSAIGLSGDGTELAAVSVAGQSYTLRVYAVATGRLRHSWSATIVTPRSDPDPVTDLSWVGDSTVAFAVTYNPRVREEVRTVDIGAAGTGLLTDSRVVWSQYVPGPRGDVYQESTPQACSTPFLTGNGKTVVCGASTYSARDKRLTATWLAYPLATPTRPRVIGRIIQPKDVSSFTPPNSVEWTNAAGTEVIGQWRPQVITYPGGTKTWSSMDYSGIVNGGTVRPLTAITSFWPNTAW
jgi:hypothetical protein